MYTKWFVMKRTVPFVCVRVGSSKISQLRSDVAELY